MSQNRGHVSGRIFGPRMQKIALRRAPGHQGGQNRRIARADPHIGKARLPRRRRRSLADHENRQTKIAGRRGESVQGGGAGEDQGAEIGDGSWVRHGLQRDHRRNKGFEVRPQSQSVKARSRFVSAGPGPGDPDQVCALLRHRSAPSALQRRDQVVAAILAHRLAQFEAELINQLGALLRIGAHSRRALPPPARGPVGLQAFDNQKKT